jgi:molybdate transport system substrate-binding protein
MHFIRILFSTSLLAAAPASAGEVLVSAASSLSNVFREMAQAYEAQYPGAKVALNFAASGVLLQQVAKGAPVDVLATADRETMDKAIELGLVKPAARRAFASNTLVVVVPANATTAPVRLADLARAGIVRIALGQPTSVPAGRYARQALDAAGLWTLVASRAVYTQNVRQALDYVARAEVDAAFVYATDAAVVKDKARIAFTVPLARPVTYPIAPLAASANAAEATRFTGFVLSPPGQAILARYGFGKP